VLKVGLLEHVYLAAIESIGTGVVIEGDRDRVAGDPQSWLIAEFC
jgi:hypothetical protein